MDTLDNLRKNAELNLCKKCYPMYVTTIEPTIEKMLTEYFHDWQGIEALVRGLVLKDLGATKHANAVLLRFNDKSKDLDQFMDLQVYEVYKKKYGRFRDRLKYLHDKKIIGDKFFQLLGELYSKRNLVHDYKTHWPEPLRIAFHMAYSWLQSIQLGTSALGDPSTVDSYLQSVKQSTEQGSEKLLAIVKALDDDQ